MKKIISISLLVLYLWFGVFPSFTVNGKVNSVRVEKIQPDQSSKCVDINDVAEIKKLIDPIAFLWTSLWPVNSWEESPRYWIILNYENGNSDRYFLSENEWRGGANPPKGYFDLVEQYTITSKCSRRVTRDA